MPVNDLFLAGNVMDATTGDLARLQQELARLQFEVDPRGGMGDTMTLALGQLHRYATGIVHVVTGRLKNSLFWEVESPRSNDLIGHVATNVAYAQAEHGRPGTKPNHGGHDFFARTVREEGPAVNDLFRTRVVGRG
jgi:hypothetical protein